MRTGTARHGDVELFFFDEGDVDAPALVLVNGAGSTAVMWCRELIDPLLAGHRVVRFDNRDVGRSTRIPASEPYEIVDLAADLRAVLDHLGLAAVNLLGRSMGGMTTMAFAAMHPERTRSITLVYTSPCLADPFEFGLRGPRREVLEAMAEDEAAPPPTTVEDRISRRVAETRRFAGARYPFDLEWAAGEATADAAHAPAARPAHGMAVMRSPSLVPVLADITCPTLIIHGTEDPIIDVGHGRFLAERIAGSRLVELEGLSHEMPPAMCVEILPELLAILA